MNRLLCGLALAMALGAGPAAAQRVVAPTETLRMSRADAMAIPQAGVTRVNADLSGRIGTWKGVRSCDDAGRARDAFMAAFNSWIGEQVTGNPNRRLVRVGTNNAPWWVENRRVGNVRSCKAGFTAAPVYADLYGQ